MLQISVPRVMPVLAAMLFMPEAEAHVKWFVPLNESSVSGFALTDPAVMIWIGLALLLITSSVILDSRLPSLPIVDSKARRIVIAILRVLTGVSLLLTAYNGSVIAPHYQAAGLFAQTLIALEAGIGFLFIINKFVFQGSLLLALLYFGTMLRFGIVEALEYLNMLGIAAFLLFNNFKNKDYQEKFKPYSVSALRIFTGIALVTLGLSEKLLSPEYGVAFIELYNWNFIQNIGFENFSNRLFVLSAGVMEVVFGIILVLGTTTRINILVVSGFMLTSNITFFIEGNFTQAMLEIIGHLPLIAIAVICVFFGYGQRLKFTTLFKSRKY
ncbi:DoxX family membrane protein [Gammaproteobacteria bacterium]|nr:DoxX family membrane protein [Gammaproteobacteria bacterium]